MKQLNFKKEFNGLANALTLIPENHKTDKNTFIMSDGNESYKIRWEGTMNEGRAITLEATNKKSMNESVDKIKHLFSYNSKDTLGKLRGEERVNEDTLFFESLNKVKTLVKENANQHYVIFDGTSAYVVDEQDMLHITKTDKDTEVIFKSMSLDKADDFANDYNSKL